MLDSAKEFRETSKISQLFCNNCKPCIPSVGSQTVCVSLCLSEVYQRGIKRGNSYICLHTDESFPFRGRPFRSDSEPLQRHWACMSSFNQQHSHIAQSHSFVFLLSIASLSSSLFSSLLSLYLLPVCISPPQILGWLYRSSSALVTLSTAVCLWGAWVICQEVTPSCRCPVIVDPICFSVNRAWFEFAQQIIKQPCLRGYCTS